MDLYQGFDSFSGNPKNTVIKSDGKNKSENASSSVRVHIIKSMKELRSSMELETSADASYGAFAVGEKSKFVSRLSLTENSILVLISSTKKILSTRMSGTSIPDDITSKMKSEQGINDFVRNYGDSFVSEITKGGEYHISFLFNSKTEAERLRVEQSLKGGGIVSGAEVDASVSAKISKAMSSSNVEVTIDRTIIGFTKEEPKYSSDSEAYVNSLVNFAFSLSALKPDKAETVSFKVTPYEDILHTDIDFSKVCKNRKDFLGNIAAPGWNEKLSKLILVMNTCKSFKETYSFYGNYSDDLLNTKLEQIKKDIDYLINFIQAVGLNPNKVYEFKDPLSYAYGIPIMQAIVLPPVNNGFLNGGNPHPFQDVTIEDISKRIRLKSVQLSYNWGVEWLGARYSTEYPKSDNKIPHGEAGSSTMQNEWILGNEEFITSISGIMTKYADGHTTVAQLYFKTNKGNTNGVEIPNADHIWNVQQGDIMIGFAGSSGKRIDCLQPLVLRFSPAIWDK